MSAPGPVASPGPGAYTVKGQMGDAPKFSFGGRTYKALQSSPGPGTYSGTSMSTRRTAPKYSLRGAGSTGNRSARREMDDTPGPGSYSPTKVPRKKAPSSSFSFRHGLSAAERTPGPGAYDIANSIGRGARYSMTSRRHTETDFNQPGPGQYHLKSRFGVVDNKAVSFKGKYGQGQSNRSPGPAAYFPSPGMGKGPQITMSAKSQLGGAISLDDGSPGPAAYVPSQSSISGIGNGVAKTFGNKRYQPSTHTTPGPGPGMYDTRSQNSVRAQAPSYSLRMRPNEALETSDTPGPGTYDGSTKWSGTSTSLYFLTQTLGSDSVPGPGTYEYSKMNVGNGGPKHSMTSRPVDLNSMDYPGPGAYEDVRQKKPPNFTFKGTYSKEIEVVPGPADYVTTPRNNGPKISMSDKCGSTVYASTSNPMNHIRG